MSTSLLLADDSPTIAKILKMALQSEAYEIRSVENAQDALKELHSNPPDIFLIDLTLPSKSGYEFSKLIRSDSKFSKTRVALLSSAFDPADDAQVAACGADLVIVKPFDPAELRNSLRLLINSKPKFPAGSQVQGSVSGEIVTPAPGIEISKSIDLGAIEPASSLPSAPAENIELNLNPASSDANDILGSLLGGNAEPSSTPSIASAPSQEPKLDFNAHDTASGEHVLDLSHSFQNPENATAMIDLSKMGNTGSMLIPTLPEQSAESATAQLSAKTPEKLAEKKSTSPAIEGLSPNAQALATFFDAEITKNPVPSLAAENEPENFDASLASIEWASPPKENLSGWSSSSVSKAAKNPAPAAKPSVGASMSANKPAAPSAPKAPASPAQNFAAIKTPENKTPMSQPAKTSSGLSGDNMLFDTGGSNFSFSPDYVNRITRAFTGDHNEPVPAHHESPMFQKQSNDTFNKEAGGGAWTDKEVQKIEQLVKDEVQMVVREVVEKIAWEVIPELAENIIKKELEKVLKQLDN